MKQLRTIAVVLALLCVGIGPALAQQVIHVDGERGSDSSSGLSWPGTLTIQMGITRARQYGIHEIWVAIKSPYYKECVLIEDYHVEMYGGFLGYETERDQRDYVNNVTIIMGHQIEKYDTNPENCPTVSIINADTTIVDGFTITGGGGTMGTRYGGGFYIMFSDSWIWNNIITGNIAIHGGGMYVQDSMMWIKNNTFSDNIAYQEGGGIHAVRCEFLPWMELNTFDNNIGTERGGGVLLDDNCGGWLKENKWQSNSAVYGGGIAYYLNSDPLTELNEFSGNGAPTRGGGIYCDASGPEIKENKIIGNTISSQGRGGGIAVHNCGPLIQRNRIKSNTCADSEGGMGGGIYLENGTSVIAGNIIDYNKVYYAGGGICVDAGSTTTITNNTIAWNDAYLLTSPPPNATCEGRGGGIHIQDYSSMMVRNTIFYNNYPDDICCYNSTVDRAYNNYTSVRNEVCVPMQCTGETCTWTIGENEMGCDPDFLDGDYHLGPRSCCIDAGTNSAPGIPGKDYVDGDARILDGNGDGTATVDIGADEIWAAVTSVQSAKGAEEGRPVDIRGGVSVTNVFGDVYYIESHDRTMGMRCLEDDHSWAPGDQLAIYGKVRTNSDCERYIDVILSEGPGEKEYIHPLGMNNLAVGAGRFPATGANYQNGVWSWNRRKDEPPWSQDKGLNNIGLLVKTWGKVTRVVRVPGHPEQEYFYIDDGSLRVDGTMTGAPPGPAFANIGVRCVIGILESLPPWLTRDRIVSVTGISSCIKPGTDPVRIIRIQTQGLVVPW